MEGNRRVTANLSLGGKLSQISGGSSVPKISAFPLRSRRRRGESETSILNSHSFSNFTCLIVGVEFEPVTAGPAPPYAIVNG